MSTDTGSDITGNDKRMARTTAIGLGVWLAITVAAVVLLLLLGDAISSLFV
ncbi:hypothetical protein NP511_15560 [Natrinema thermotolerans]|uniref:Uncharacterized protein n=1 Tax=Natrinema thermotolerans TaxID=121872 RepID=A0AAF0T133_9EURY|nr:hypothetical protein [Natrinema thermotolerans]ELZ12364.1 hypothetical protein C478_09821 [Natrinema thermotolerans DSM 11552]WMT06797.1 hypothetical protein NP511_15560 [Natrinema thermotolerans]